MARISDGGIKGQVSMRVSRQVNAPASSKRGQPTACNLFTGHILRYVNAYSLVEISDQGCPGMLRH
jgi:hypothetical protein